MARRLTVGVAGGLSLVLAIPYLIHAAGCKGSGGHPALSKSAEPIDISKIPVPPANGPQLGAVANVTPVLARPERGAKEIGYLHAGAKVPRSTEPISKEGCNSGWYAIRPRGFVCGDLATTDLNHPTLVAMSLQPRHDQALPYTYARVEKPTRLLKRDPNHDKRVVTERKLARRSGLAVVGSWEAKDEEQADLRLGMLTNGTFVPAADLVAAEPSPFKGVELPEGRDDLPVAFVVKRGVRRFKYDDKLGEWIKAKPLEYHETIELTGKFRTSGALQYWAATDDTYVRHQDVTVIRRLHSFPPYATGKQKWVDISIITGTAVLYEGTTPVFATLVSVGRDRLGDPKETASTAQGDFEVTAKHIASNKLDPKVMSEYYEVHDVPWVLELSSGQLMHGTYWHDRFGIEEGPGHVAWSAEDAQRVWHWATPEVPVGWHSVKGRSEREAKTIVRVRK